MQRDDRCDIATRPTYRGGKAAACRLRCYPHALQVDDSYPGRRGDVAVVLSRQCGANLAIGGALDAEMAARRLDLDYGGARQVPAGRGQRRAREQDDQTTHSSHGQIGNEMYLNVQGRETHAGEEIYGLVRRALLKCPVRQLGTICRSDEERRNV